jgi:hypothetical protein
MSDVIETLISGMPAIDCVSWLRNKLTEAYGLPVSHWNFTEGKTPSEWDFFDPDPGVTIRAVATGQDYSRDNTTLLMARINATSVRTWWFAKKHVPQQYWPGQAEAAFDRIFLGA